MIPTKYIEPRTELAYPNFNDAPHARPVLVEGSLRRVLFILGGLLIGLPALAWLLSIF